MTTITEYFASLGAPLKNMNWSWGAVADGSNPAVPAGTVILRTWTGNAYQFREKTYYHIYETGQGGRSHGQPERERHIELIKQGAKCLLVIMVLNSKGNNVPCEIKEYDKTLHPTGELLITSANTAVYIEAV